VKQRPDPAPREGRMLALATACNGPHADLIMVLGLEGLRWGEVAGLRVGDRLSVPGPWTAAVNNGTGQ
jgi:hypothetical protein